MAFVLSNVLNYYTQNFCHNFFFSGENLLAVEVSSYSVKYKILTRPNIAVANDKLTIL